MLSNDFFIITIPLYSLKSIHIHIPKNSESGFINNQQEDWDFKFDQILHNASQECIFDECGAPILKSLIDGYNGILYNIHTPIILFKYNYCFLTRRY